MTLKDVKVYTSKPLPAKRLKKRKELNALIGGDVSAKKCLLTNNCYLDHEAQIEPNSLSSKFSIYRNQKKKSSLRRGYIFFCLLVCSIALIISCAVSSVGIVWMEIQLKHEILYIKERLKKLDTFAYQETREILDIKNQLTITKHEINEMKYTNRLQVQQLDVKISSLLNQIPPDHITSLENDQNVITSSLYEIYKELISLQSQVKIHPSTIVSKQVDLMSKEIFALNHTISILLHSTHGKTISDSLIEKALLPTDNNQKYPKFPNKEKQNVNVGSSENFLNQRQGHPISQKAIDKLKIVSPSVGAREVSESSFLVHDTDTEVGDTTTSFTALPTGNHVIK